MLLFLLSTVELQAWFHDYSAALPLCLISPQVSLVSPFLNNDSSLRYSSRKTDCGEDTLGEVVAFSAEPVDPLSLARHLSQIPSVPGQPHLLLASPMKTRAS